MTFSAVTVCVCVVVVLILGALVGSLPTVGDWGKGKREKGKGTMVQWNVLMVSFRKLEQRIRSQNVIRASLRLFEVSHYRLIYVRSTLNTDFIPEVCIRLIILLLRLYIHFSSTDDLI